MENEGEKNGGTDEKWDQIIFLFPVEFSEQLLRLRAKIWRGKEVVLTIYIPSRPLNNIVEEYGPALPSH